MNIDDNIQYEAIKFIEDFTVKDRRYSNNNGRNQGWRLLIIKHNPTKKFLPVVKRSPYFLRSILNRVKSREIKNDYLFNCLSVSDDFSIFDYQVDGEDIAITLAENLVHEYKTTDQILLKSDSNFFFPIIPDKLREIIDGCLAGDGYISPSDNRTSRFVLTLSETQKGHLEDFVTELRSFGYLGEISEFHNAVNKRNFVTVRWTLKAFNIERERWYSLGTKRLPLDIKNSKNFWRWFYAGDGSLRKIGAYTSRASIASNDFPLEDIDRLVIMLNELGIAAKRYKSAIGKNGIQQWVLNISIKSTPMFLEYISPAIKSIEYKWNYPIAPIINCEICKTLFEKKRVNSKTCSTKCGRILSGKLLKEDSFRYHRLQQYKRTWYENLKS